MTEEEKKYYQNIKNNPKDYLFNRLFRLNASGETESLPGIRFSLLNGIPFIEDVLSLQKQFSSPLFAMQSPLESIMTSPETEPYISPFFEMNKPKDGSLLKLSKPMSIFDDGSGGRYTYYPVYKPQKTGSEVLLSYQKSDLPLANQMLLFCEETPSEKSNLFGTFLLVKYGSAYHSRIQNLKSDNPTYLIDKITDTTIKNFNDEVFSNWSFLMQNGISITEDRVRFAMNVAYRSDQITLGNFFGGLEKGISYCAEGLNTFIENHKFTKEDYTPSKSEGGFSLENFVEGLYDFGKQTTKLLLPDKIQNLISQNFDRLVSGISQVSWNLIPKEWKTLLRNVWNLVQQGANLIKKVTETGLKYAAEQMYMLRALLMGFVNGFLSLLQMILIIAGWVLKKVLVTDAHKQVTGEKIQEYQSYMEMVEDLYDILSENASGFFSSVESLVKEFSLDKLSSVLKVFTDKLKGLTKYDYAYFTGSFMFEVVIGVLMALFTGGTSVIAQSGQKLTKLLNLIGREVLSTATMGIVDFLQLAKTLITKFVNACRKGWNGFKHFIEKLLHGNNDEIVKTEGKVLDNIEDIGTGLYGGKILSKSELDDWAKLLKKKYNTNLVKVEKFEYPDILAQFDAVTNTIKYKGGATNYLIFHESKHAEECFKLGKKKYLKDAHIVGTPLSDANLIRMYKREKYVYEQIKKYAKEQGFNSEELWHNEMYFDTYIIKLEKRNIPIPKN